MKRLCLLAVFAAQCVGLSLAHADSISSPASVRREVSFDDLDLGQLKGVTTLYSRIRVAADQVCSLPDERRLERGRQFQACVEEAVAAAVVRIDQPLLSSYHRATLDRRRLVSANELR